MVFSPNPLSLSVSDPAFETWLRNTGYLNTLDQRTTQLHQTQTSTSKTTKTSSSTFSLLITLIFSLFTINPFSKLNSDDFGNSVSWTESFFGCCESYSVPTSKSQAEMRVHENVKRYARNYACLFVLFFGCSLYQMPLALVGLIACLVLWEVLKFCSDKYTWDRYPAVWQCLIRVYQCVAAVILVCSNVQMAFFCTLGISYAVMVLHAAFRKLAPAELASRGRRK